MSLKKLLFCKLLRWHSYGTFPNYNGGASFRKCVDCGKPK